MAMFSIAYRQQVSGRVIEWAESDNRIVAGATIGSLAVKPNTGSARLATAP